MTSKTTSASASTSSPSPVTASTPVDGEATTTSCQSARSRCVNRLPTTPVPPSTTIFNVAPCVILGQLVSGNLPVLHRDVT